jgi:hypothetical protein
MNCPHCKKVLTLNNPVLYNVEAYHISVVAVALCCGRGVKVIPKMSFEIIKYMGKENHDDWGHDIKQTEVGPAPISLLASSVL